MEKCEQQIGPKLFKTFCQIYFSIYWLIALKVGNTNQELFCCNVKQYRPFMCVTLHLFKLFLLRLCYDFVI